jgi:hypothetical protein
MKNIKNRDYTKMTAIAVNIGFTPYFHPITGLMEGKYTYKGYKIPIDLSASAEDEKSILKNAVEQLCEQILCNQ